MRPLATLSPLLSRLDRAAQLAYGLAAVIATAALWGWALDVPRLRDLGADFAQMAPGEALAFLLLASSFYASHREGHRHRRAAYSAAAVAAALGLFGFVEALSGQSLGMSFGRAAMSAATSIMVLALALVTPLARDASMSARRCSPCRRPARWRRCLRRSRSRWGGRRRGCSTRSRAGAPVRW